MNPGQKSPEETVSVHPKVAEYIQRIRDGESKESILQGLSPSFVRDIEKGIADTALVETDPASLIPPQYKGMSAEALEEIWDINLQPVSVSNEMLERLEQEAINKRVALDWLRQNEQKYDTKPPVKSQAPARPEQHIDPEDYKHFRVKNGETDIGVYWYQYENQAAKKLKQSGQLEWGKERLYFDIPLDKLEAVRDLAFKIAGEENIAIGFKHLDTGNTNKIDLDPKSETTRFVANFASAEDAKRFYTALANTQEYTSIKPDRNVDYHGFNIDGIAHYASGFREQREPLMRMIASAKRNTDGTYSYPNKDGSKIMTITEGEFEAFKKILDSLPDPKTVWNSA